MLGIAHFQELHIFQQELKSCPILANWHAILKKLEEEHASGLRRSTRKAALDAKQKMTITGIVW